MVSGILLPTTNYQLPTNLTFRRRFSLRLLGRGRGRRLLGGDSGLGGSHVGRALRGELGLGLRLSLFLGLAGRLLDGVGERAGLLAAHGGLDGGLALRGLLFGRRRS